MGKIEDIDAAETAEQMQVIAGRREPFTQCPDWILLAPVSRGAKLCYWTLKAHVNMEREKVGNTEVWPTQNMIAEIMGLAEGRQIRPYLKQLITIEAIEVRKVRHRGKMRQRSIYTVHGTPPDGYDNPKSLKDFYAARAARIRAAQQEEADGADQVMLDFAS
jgi:hypothetical protein